jgi:3-dehydroquinate synthetase
LERVTVSVPGWSYDAVIGERLIERADELVPDLPRATRAFVVADRAVADDWFPTLCDALDRRGLRSVLLSVPAGEDAKTLDVYRTLVHQLEV